MITPLLEVKALSKSVHLDAELLMILQPLSFNVYPGTSTALIGRSGSGKTTLLGLMAGLDTPTSGELYLLGHPFHHLSEEARAKVRANNVGFIFQNFQLLPNLSVLENVLFPLELLGVANAREKALEALVKVELSHRLNHYPSLLSGGEQQRVAIARAIANTPNILFADEPTGNLDARTGETIEALLFDLIKEIQTTLVLVTHNEQLAKRCTQIIHLEQGTVG